MGCLVFMAVNWSILLSDTDTTHDDAGYLKSKHIFLGNRSLTGDLFDQFLQFVMVNDFIKPYSPSCHSLSCNSFFKILFSIIDGILSIIFIIYFLGSVKNFCKEPHFYINNMDFFNFSIND